MSKTYFVTYINEDGHNEIDMYDEIQNAQEKVADCFERKYEGITVYESVEMELSINVSLTAKKELPF